MIAFVIAAEMDLGLKLFSMIGLWVLVFYRCRDNVRKP